MYASQLSICDACIDYDDNSRWSWSAGHATIYEFSILGERAIFRKSTSRAWIETIVTCSLHARTEPDTTMDALAPDLTDSQRTSLCCHTGSEIGLRVWMFWSLLGLPSGNQPYCAPIKPPPPPPPPFAPSWDLDPWVISPRCQCFRCQSPHRPLLYVITCICYPLRSKEILIFVLE